MNSLYTAEGVMDKHSLWQRYVPLVRHEALRLQVRLPASVELDDLLQAGGIGLLNAVERYDALQGTAFTTYAVQRIRGAMLDELRSRDWVPRSVRRNAREVAQAIGQLEQELGRNATETEVAERLGIDIADYRQMLLDTNNSQLFSYDEWREEHGDSIELVTDDHQRENPLQQLLDSNLRQRVMEAIETLPEREKLVFFVGQFYLQGSQMRTLPGEILLDFNLSDKTLLADSLSELAGRKINVQTKPRGDRARYLKLARTNAATALTSKLSQQSTVHQRLTALASVLKLPEVKRMECFDISHTMGEQTVASCVVFDANGPLRAEYRRYNITGITPGDDYAAMNQVLRRRYGKAIDDSKIPDVILIDGGKGQLAQAKNVFAELDVSWDKNHPLLLGVAKGADRKAGLETLFFEPEGEGFSLPPDSPALHVIQHIRDESHDHAIGGHRKKRAKVKNTSSLETIEGVGPKRRQMLLKYMGGLQGLRNASVEEIAKVPGISQGLAEKIFWSLKH